MAEARRAHHQKTGDSFFYGDPAITGVLQEALRCSGEVDRATHGFHSYPAGLHPDAAKLLLALGEGPVLDPFCGGGTVLVEALLAGRSALGLDISPVATLVARSRTTRTDEAARTALRSRARAIADHAKTVPFPRNAPEGADAWYHPGVIAELCAIRDGIAAESDKSTRELLRAVFSSILVKVSHRESDTANRKVEQSRAAGSTSILFHARAREYGRQLEALEAAIPSGDIRARVHREDVREFRSKETFGMVVTSPPYPGVYDYLTMQQLRWMWLGIEPGTDSAELGSRRAFRLDRAAAVTRWRTDTLRWVRTVAKVLNQGGKMVVILGDGWVGNRAVESLPPLLEAAEAAGLKVLAGCTAERWDEGSGGLRPEHALLFQKSA